MQRVAPENLVYGSEYYIETNVLDNPQDASGKARGIFLHLEDSPFRPNAYAVFRDVRPIENARLQMGIETNDTYLATYSFVVNATRFYLPYYRNLSKKILNKTSSDDDYIKTLFPLIPVRDPNGGRYRKYRKSRKSRKKSRSYNNP
jgi:hypothetical protein